MIYYSKLILYLNPKKYNILTLDYIENNFKTKKSFLKYNLFKISHLKKYV